MFTLLHLTTATRRGLASTSPTNYRVARVLLLIMVPLVGWGLIGGSSAGWFTAPGVAQAAAIYPLSAWGSDSNGQVGNGVGGIRNSPLVVNLAGGATPTALAAGYQHSLAIANDGKLYAWGNNNYGQLGNGSTSQTSNPAAVSLPAGVTPTAVAGGFYHSLAIGSDGKLYAWGYNSDGELGNGSTTNSTIPVTVTLPQGVTPTAIAGGYYHNLAIGSDSKLYAWGANVQGQLGNGSTSSNPNPNPAVVNLPQGITPIAIAAGYQHSLAIGSDSKLYAWGYNGYGQLGNGTTNPSPNPVIVNLPQGVTPTAIAAGESHSLAIGSDGKLYAWGWNGAGQLGNGTTTDSATPVVVNLPAGVRPTVMAAGYYHNLAIGSNGRLYVWGANGQGQLGNGTLIQSTTPFALNSTPGIASPLLAGGGTHTLAQLAVPARQIITNNGTPQRATVSTAYPAPLVVSVRDAANNPVNNVGVTFTAPASGASGTFAGGNPIYNATTDTSGTVTATVFTANTLAGSYTITATVSGVITPATFALTNTTPATLYAWGYNTNGQLGIGSYSNSASPVAVNLPPGVAPTTIAAGAYHSLAIGSDSNLYAWGYNGVGQLGNGSTTSSATPITVSLPAGVRPTAVAVGQSHSLTSGSDGKLYAWGANTYGQLGNGSTTDSTTPITVSLPAGVRPVAIAAGLYHSLAIGSDGNLYAWGGNSNGQLGNGTTANSTIPIIVSLPQGVVPTTITAGVYHSLAIGSDGNLYAWGVNTYGQLGNGTTASSTTPVLVNLPAGVTPTAVAAGLYFSLANGNDGKLYAWGANGNGQLGNGTTSGSTTPVVVSLPQGVVPTAIAAGLSHSLAIGNDSHLYAWGANTYGQLGNGTFSGPNPNPVAVGSTAGIANPLLASGGNHTLAQLTIPTQPVVRGGTPQRATVGTAFPAPLVVTVRDVANNPVNNVAITFTAPASGASGTFAGGSSVYTATTDATGTVTATAFTANPIAGSYTVTATVSGVSAPAAFALTNTTRTPLYAWGYNGSGQLGNGSTTNSSSPIAVNLPPGVVPTTIAAKFNHNLAIGSDSQLYAWGYNYYGQLGNGTTTDSATPVTVTLPAGVRSTAVAVGSDHSLAIGSDGKLYAWGFNQYGQLGNGSTANSATPVTVNLPAGVRPIAIAAGLLHSLAIGSDGNLYTWGSNSNGQLGNGTTANSATPIIASLPQGVVPTAIVGGGYHSLAIGSDGKLYAWGANGQGQLGNGTTANSSTLVTVNLPQGVTPTAVAAGDRHSLAIGSDGKLYAWGWNYYGQLGNGTTNDSSTPVMVNLPQGVTPIAITAGYYHNLTSGSDGKLYAWGTNYYGQLGNGTTSSTNPTPIEAGSTAGIVNPLLAGGDHTLAQLALPSQVVSSGGTPQQATVGTDYPAPLVATVRDIANQPLTSVAVTFTAPASGASGTFAGGSSVYTATTDASGTVTATTFTANNLAGSYTVTATVSGVITPATFTLTNIAGAPANIGVISGDGQSATVTNLFANPLVVSVTDQYNNPVSGTLVTFNPPASGPSATFVQRTATTGANGQATSSALVANGLAGSYTISVTVSGVITPANFTLTNTPGPASALVVTGGNNQQTVVNTSFASPLVVKVADIYGNGVSGVVVGFVPPVSGASALFAGGILTATTGSDGLATSASLTANSIAGSYSLTATVSGVNTSAIFNLTNLSGCNPLLVTSRLDDGSCGTLRAALIAASTSPTKTVTLSLSAGSVISLTTGLTLTSGVAITTTAPCGVGGGNTMLPPVIIQGVGSSSGNGLTLAGNNRLYGLWVRGFSGVQIKAPPGSSTKMQCVRASKL